MSCIGASCEIHDDLRSAGVANALQPKANCSRNIGRYTRIARNHSAPASLKFGDHRVGIDRGRRRGGEIAEDVADLHGDGHRLELVSVCR